MTENDFKRNTTGLQQRAFETQVDHTLTRKTPGYGGELDALPTSSVPNPVVDLKDVLPAAVPSKPEPSRPARPARYKIVCSYQNFFEQQRSSSSSRVVFLKGQDLEFRIVDTEQGDADDFPTADWVWSLVKITSARRQERKESSTFLGSGTYLRTNDLFLGEWRLIAKHRLRRESCSIVLVGRSTNDWSIFKGILPKARLDPDGYLERMSKCLRVNMLGNRCEEAADPSDGTELPTVGADSWEVHARLEKRLARTKGQPRIPIQALYTDLSAGRNYALRVFLAVVDGKWLLTDWSCPTMFGRTGWYEGGAFVGDEGDREGILKAIKAWEDGNRYGFGSIHWRVLVPTVAFELQGAFSTSGTTDLDEFSQGLQYVGTAGMFAELAPNPAVKGAGKVVVNLSFAVSSGLNIYQRWSQGFNSFTDWMENGLDLLVIALTLAGIKRETSEIFAKAGVRNAQALAEAGEEVIVSGKKWSALAKFEFGAGIGMVAVCHVTAFRTVRDIQRRTDLTPAQKVDLLVEALELLVLQDLIMIVTLTKAVFKGAKPESSSGIEENAPGSVTPLEGESRTLKYVIGRSLDADASGRIGESGRPSGGERNAPSNTEMDKPPEVKPRSLRHEGEKTADADSRGKTEEGEKTSDLENGTHPETEKQPESDWRAFSEEESRPNESKSKSMESETHLDEFPGKTDSKQHETIVSRGRRGQGGPKEDAQKPEEPPKPGPVVEPEPPKAWPRETDAHPPSFEKGKPAERSWDQWFREERMRDVPNVKRDQLKVAAYTEINGERFIDYNQNARVNPLPEELTAIYEFIKSRALVMGIDIAKFPNWKHLNLHAEGGLLYQLYRAGLTNGAKIVITVEGRKVCGFCLNDLIALSKAMGIEKLTIVEKNVFDKKVPQILEWKKGEESWTKTPPDAI